MVHVLYVIGDGPDQKADELHRYPAAFAGLLVFHYKRREAELEVQNGPGAGPTCLPGKKYPKNAPNGVDKPTAKCYTKR
jgi:hypothetical protein